MDRISAQTRSGILLEALYYLDRYESERIILYKSLVTANRIQISFDFATQLIYISAILPIDSVDLSRPVTDPERIVFPSWNTSVDIVDIRSNVLVPGYNVGIVLPSDGASEEGSITYTAVPYAGDAAFLAPALVYSSALTIELLDGVRQTPRKNIQITIDEPNLKAIVEAVLPFDSYLNSSGGLFIIPLDS